jgi:putative tryptophan/tyrosine transport system substrate-binding protein
VTTYTRRQVVRGAGAVGLVFLAGCGRLPGQAPPARMRRIGVLFPTQVDPQMQPFWDSLHQHGWTKGENLIVEHRSTESEPNDLAASLSELAHLPVDLLVTYGFPAAQAAKATTPTIPIVIIAVSDPVLLGLVASFAQPGGNITGVTFVNDGLVQKQLQILKEALPQVRRVATLWNSTNSSSRPRLGELERAALAVGVELQSIEARAAHDLEQAFAAATQEGADALIAIPDQLLTAYRARIVDLAAMHRLPAIYYVKSFVTAGGLMAYGADFDGQLRRAAALVDKVLKGIAPADLPVEQPREFDFVINLRTAQALGLTIPPHVLLQATEVIQ